MEKAESKRRNSKKQDVMGERTEDSPVRLCRRALEELMCLGEDAQETREER